MDPPDAGSAHTADPLLGAEYLAATVIDTRGRVLAWSPGLRQLLGYRADEVVGRPVTTLLDTRVTATTRRRLLEGPGGSGRVVFRHRDDRPVGTEVLAHPWTDGAGESRRLLVATPVPVQRHMATTLLKWAADQIPFAAAILDPELRYVEVNQQTSRAWNLTPDEMLGRSAPELLHTPESDEVAAGMRQAVDKGEPVHVESYAKLPGERRGHAWSVHNTPLKDASGRVRGLHTLGIDITGEYLARKRLALLNDASTSIGSTLDVRRTADELAQVLVPVLADFVTVDLIDTVLTDKDPQFSAPTGSVALRRMAVRSIIEGAPEALHQPGQVITYPEFSPHATAMITGRSFATALSGDPLFERWLGSKRERAEKYREYGIHSTMVVPLRARGATLGVALFSRHTYPDDFDEDDLLLAEEITARAAVCLDNALRYTRQRDTALTLQHSLLPQELPRQSAMRVAGRYLPADNRTGVGGDWFDVIPLSGARVALVVGDVVGHGVHASATMGRLRTAVRTLADVELPPDELLTHLDDLVGRPSQAGPDAGELRDADTGATILYAVYNPVSRRCAMARAGHPPPALVLPDGSVEFLDVPAGPPLGLGVLPFENFEVPVPEGGVLALYTDGLIESRRHDVDHGMAELGRELSRPAGSLGETCDKVLGALLSGRPHDDVALLLARGCSLGPESVATREFPADPAIVGAAREFTARQLSEWGLEEVAFTTELLVSELVTNAIRYATGPVQLRMILENTLICEVSDRSDTFPHLRRANIDDEGGRGLLLVAQLSRRWGTRPTATGKTIWADQSIPADRRVPAACGP